MGRQTILVWKGMPLDWTDQDVAIVASGPSAAKTDLMSLQGRCRVIAINHSWQLVPWADLLYGTDYSFWCANKGVPKFNGRKMTSSPSVGQMFGLDVVFTIGVNSGVRAIHLAKALNARRVLLIGFDMHDRDGLHWHPPHKGNAINPSAASMRLWVDELNKIAGRIGVPVINCTPGSAIRCFPLMPLRDALSDDDVQVRAD